MKSHLIIIKIIFTVSIIISISTALGIAFYLVNFKRYLPAIERPVLEPMVDSTTEPISDVESSWKTYRNSKYNFEFNYPLDYTLKEVSNNYILLRKIEDKKTEWSICITVEHNRLGTNDFELTFREFVERLAMSGCVADGPDGSTDCTEITEIKPFINKNKINGYEIYMNENTENFLNNKISNRIKGPIFTMNTSEQTSNLSRSIFFDFDDEERILNKQEKQVLIDQILSTFKFTEK